MADPPSLVLPHLKQDADDTGGRSIFMSDNYIVEIRSTSLGITVQAGVVVRDGHRFRFYAATRAFNSLEGQLFKSPGPRKVRRFVISSRRRRVVVSTAAMSRANESRTQPHTA